MFTKSVAEQLGMFPLPVSERQRMDLLNESDFRLRALRFQPFCWAFQSRGESDPVKPAGLPAPAFLKGS